ncbi:MAG: D-alanyl-D-alanine carboxypeptidase family protein [Hyphomicrobiaceae bacterium]
MRFQRLGRLAYVLVAAVLTTLAMGGGSARAAFETSAPYAILMDAESGAVLFEKDADKLVPPASMSKLMTLAVAFHALKTGTLTMDDKFTVSEHAWRTGGGPSGTSAMFVYLKSAVAVSDLLQGIIVQSGNDACITLAEGMAGSEEAFAELMTTEARRLGLPTSTFGNATGLPHPKQLMSVRELGLLARHLILDYPEFYKMFSQKSFEYNNGRKTFNFINRNPLLGMGIGADGLKTGYIEDAGYGLVGSAVQEGRRLIVVINGTTSNNERGAEARKLLDWGFSNFKEVPIFDAGEIVGEARVWGGSSYYVKLVGNGPINILVPRVAAKNRLKAEIIYNGPLKPPIHKGDEVARIRVEHVEAGVNEVPLYAAEDVEEGGIVAKGLDAIILKAFSWLL